MSDTDSYILSLPRSKDELIQDLSILKDDFDFSNLPVGKYFFSNFLIYAYIFKKNSFLYKDHPLYDPKSKNKLLKWKIETKGLWDIKEAVFLRSK